jgi:hypothetical protein
MFDHTHYVPVLRWKQAEWLALRHLGEEERARITPLVEITRRSVAPRTRRPTIEQMLRKNATDMQANWGLAPLFVDLWHLEPNPALGNGLHPFVYLAQEARARGVSIVPVAGLNRPPDYQVAVASVVATHGLGACLRLHATDLARPTLEKDLEGLLAHLSLSRGEVDLVIDFEYVHGACPDWSGRLATIPEASNWRTTTLLSGAFPLDLTGFKVGEHCLPRLDWQAWCRFISARSGLPRLPAYGDYTTQHAYYREPPANANVSASIRYAADDHWVIMRGEGLRNENGPGYAQYRSNAQLLCARPEFRGRNFSYGDRYIFEMSLQTQQTGSPETWLRAGINHHLALVSRQMANLFGT